MHGIHEFLSRYAHITPPDMVVRKKLGTILSEELGRTVFEKDIRIIGPIAYCSFESALKNALFMKKTTILARLESEFGKHVLRDIQ